MSFSMVERSIVVSEVAKREVLRCPAGVRSLPPPACRVIASEDLKSGISSRAFSVSELASSRVGEIARDVYVGITARGFLEIMPSKNEHSSIVWQNFPSLAPDIHSSNIHLEVNRHCGSELEKTLDRFVLKITKDVQQEGELLMWFSEEVLAIINMPFLTPKNITGHKKYSCHICSESFEYPNPLKIHILLSCGRESSTHLWQKIAKIMWKQNNSSGLRFGYKLGEHRASGVAERPSSAHLPAISTKTVQSARCISEPPISAFLPYKRRATDSQCDITKICSGLENCPTSTPTLVSTQPLNLCTSQPTSNELKATQPPWIRNVLELRLSKSLEELSSNYAADVELFASNWGKLKQGHLCVYCGKVYSRKYGLKIHIRTHTGYKPLRCKFCQRPFGDPSNLNKHVRLHASGHAPYMCSLCGKVLVRRRDLERHMKSQHVNDDCSSDGAVDID